jgi:hypothetical protein
VAVRGTFKQRGKPGANSVRFRGRLGGRALQPGRYVLVARASAPGAKAKRSRVRFRIVGR